MKPNFSDIVRTIVQDQDLRCPVCGATRYITDEGNHDVTLHCSSREARFWDFDRGSKEQANAREHWDESRKDVFLGDLL